MALLEVTELKKGFEGLQVLEGVNINIEEGEMTGLIGPNGAGKTTFFNCLTGILSPDAGTVVFRGKDVTGQPTYKLTRDGMVRTFQLARELDNMTVLENMKVAPINQLGEQTLHAVTLSQEMLQQESEIHNRALELLNTFDLDHLADEYAVNLSGGQRKLLGLARSLMADPDLLLLDEPFAGVNPTLQGRIADHIADLNEDGMTFFIVEHEIEELSNLVDRIIALHNGVVLADDRPDDILSNEKVISAYLGDQRITEED